MRPALALLQSYCLLYVFSTMCVPVVVGSLPPALPWYVPCPVRCVCQIKPWFSLDSVYHEAPTVDCNNLLLTKLPYPLPLNTHTLRLQSNLLSALDTAVLHGLPNLTDLDLSQNRFSYVKMITQSSPLPSLLSIHLEENHLTHLPEASFSLLSALQELFLSHNNLHLVAPGAFNGLNSLRRLHINNNRLTTIDPRWFRALPQLEVLMLGGNPVQALPERGFVALKSLRSLVLGGMGLRGLAEKALEGLEELESLSFFDNHLTKVPRQALKRVPGLKFLDLNKNRIKLIETGDFKDMVNLKELGLNNMEELVSIDKASLENLPELTKLEITNNPRLSYVHPQAFVRLNRLESLMLNSNSLSALHQNIILSLPSLQEVSLHSNPLRCDCLFHWAARDTSHPRVERVTQMKAEAAPVVRFIQPEATLCSAPSELRARRVREVSSGEMSTSCLPTIPASSLPSYVGVQEGGKLVLHCRALAEPTPELYWVTPSGLRLGPSTNSTSGGLSASAVCINATSDGFNNKSATSYKHMQAQNDTVCQFFKHYQLLPEGNLEISRITFREAGLYTCVAENGLGADTRSVTVGVHNRGKNRKRVVVTKQKKLQAINIDARLELNKVGEHYAILSWQSRQNLPSTRLSWQAVHSNTDSHSPTYTTRILAGTQSFNLTHLQADTIYRVCLHLGISEDGLYANRGSGESKKHCVSFRTQSVPEPRSGLQLNPELTSVAVTLLLLAYILLLSVQGWDAPPVEEAGKHHNPLILDVKGPKTVIITQKKKENNEEQTDMKEKLASYYII
ncbi:leucine-rich repeat neuronal protein 2-like [Cyprinodon tularosa]|uniref:leucine-rich repeat neuronal protein 2-like n=1 Tax=Cyprinodon tularosa TaxID=77115 RepID=UPI0018E255F6|nr:leucine-rich repeat neuronal protein 2-like [Cyprinodon tularosa]